LQVGALESVAGGYNDKGASGDSGDSGDSGEVAVTPTSEAKRPEIPRPAGIPRQEGPIIVRKRKGTLENARKPEGKETKHRVRGTEQQNGDRRVEKRREERASKIGLPSY